MPQRQYSGCEGLPYDSLEKLRERFRQREQTASPTGLKLDSAVQHAESQKLHRGHSSASDRPGEHRGRGCSG